MTPKKYAYWLNNDVESKTKRLEELSDLNSMSTASKTIKVIIWRFYFYVRDFAYRQNKKSS